MESSQSDSTSLISSSRRLPKFSNLSPWLWVLVGLLAVGGGGWFVWRLMAQRGAPPEAGFFQTVPVTLQRLQSETLEESSTFVGTLEAQAGVVLRPEAAGQIIEVLATSGEQVTAGTPIFQLSPEKDRAELSAAQASISAARAARDNAQSQLKSLEAQQRSAVAEVELQVEELERTAYLVSQGAQSEQELDLVRRDRESAIADLNAAKEQIEAAKASLSQSDAALTEAEADANAIRQDLLDKTVFAPIDGVVGDIPVKLGEYVGIGETLTTITQNQSLELEFSVAIEDMARLRVGLPVELTRFGETETIATGTVSFISPQTDPNSQSTLVKTRFTNPTGQLQDSQKVEARVIWEQRPGLLIPTESVARLAGQTFVFVAESGTSESGEPQQIARQKPVKLGAIQGSRYQVLEGLSPGEMLVVSGILNLSDGVPIAPNAENAFLPISLP